MVTEAAEIVHRIFTLQHAWCVSGKFSKISTGFFKRDPLPIFTTGPNISSERGVDCEQRKRLTALQINEWMDKHGAEKCYEHCRNPLGMVIDIQGNMKVVDHVFSIPKYQLRWCAEKPQEMQMAIKLARAQTTRQVAAIFPRANYSFSMHRKLVERYSVVCVSNGIAYDLHPHFS